MGVRLVRGLHGSWLGQSIGRAKPSFTSHDNLEGIVTSEYFININIIDISICKYSNINL